ncbi:MAG: heavy-metal-associated domain-containing protein [Chitinophagaceae bacterium]|nr:MAG: heavy-metal-associated domain-containing protein [Chitinophagaceae bacterium]
MTHDYSITGMTCGKCVAKVKSGLLKTAGVLSADVSLEDKSARITMDKHISLPLLQEAVSGAGAYTISARDAGSQDMEDPSPDVSYRPIQLIFGYLLLVTVLLQWRNGFDLMAAMQVFMGGFFLVFSFFKLMNLRGFAEGYGTYDIVAAVLPAWGFIYPFVELVLGLAFITGIAPLAVNILTLFVMGISSIGVIRSVMQKRQVQCACLGTVIRLPLGKVTLVEDLLMVVMSAVMILYYISM